MRGTIWGRRWAHGHRRCFSRAATPPNNFVATIGEDLQRHMAVVQDTVPASEGRVATYIPQLAKANPETFGAAICGVKGEFVSSGDDTTVVGLQSCVKPFT